MAADVDAVGAGHADAAAGDGEDVRDESRGGRLAVDAGDGDDRNAAVFVVGEHHVDDRFADGARRAGRGLQVHPQAGAGVDFDDDATLLGERTADVAADDVDAGDVEADRAGGVDGLAGDVGVDDVGDVGRGAAGAEVRVAANEHFVAGGGNGIGREALLGQHRRSRRHRA